MTIVVTGASGFIGRRVVALLKAAGRSVCTVEHRWKDSDDLAALLPQDIEACLHLGWYADPADYLSNTHENRASFRNGLDLAREARRRGAERLVVAGTSAEYRPSPSRLVETDPTAPTTIYGECKVELFEALTSGSRLDGLSIRWARIFNVTGPGEPPTRFLPSVARAVLAAEPLELSSGEQVRDFAHVDDVAAGLIALEGAPEGGTFNICSGEGHSLRSVAEELGSRLGDTSALKFGARPRCRP